MNKHAIKKILSLVLALLAITASLASALASKGTSADQPDSNQKSEIFHGAWFDVRYP